MRNLEYALIHGWALTEKGKLMKRFEFNDFKQSMTFVNRIATLADKRNHHPDIKIKYNKVTISLMTHDAGALTSKDYDMAEGITQIYHLIA